MSTLRAQWKMISALLLVIGLIGGYLVFQQSITKEKRESSKRGEIAPMEGMAMGINETGQATTMLTPEGTALIGLKTTEVKEGEAVKVIRAVGKVAYDERRLAQINTRVEGWIQDLFVNFTGQEVKKGEPLFTFYSPDLFSTQQEYLLARKGQQSLGASPMTEVRQIGETLVSSAKKRLLLWNITEAQIKELEARGEPETDMTIHAPISGVVTKKEGVAGMHVSPGMTLYEIVDLSTLWVLADIYEQEISFIRKGVLAHVTVAALPGEIFKGRVTFIDPFLNPQTRTARVRLELANPGLRLKPEMFAHVEFHAKVGKGLLVPESAILDSGLRQIVFVDKGMEMYEPREVQARRINGQSLVSKGLTKGERVVTSANFLIDSESKLMASSDMMGSLGMGGIRMEQAKMGEMEMGMKMGTGEAKTPKTQGPQTRKAGTLTLTLFTEPSPPIDGANLLRLKALDSSGKLLKEAVVFFSYTMPMPGMKEVKVPALFTGSHFEAKVKFGMPGIWEVTVFVTPPGKPEIREKFVLDVVSEMAGMPGM